MPLTELAGGQPDPPVSFTNLNQPKPTEYQNMDVRMSLVNLPETVYWYKGASRADPGQGKDAFVHLSARHVADKLRLPASEVQCATLLPEDVGGRQGVTLHGSAVAGTYQADNELPQASEELQKALAQPTSNAGANDLLSHVTNREAMSADLDPVVIAHAKLHPASEPPTNTTPYCTPRSRTCGLQAMLAKPQGAAVTAGLQTTLDLMYKLPALEQVLKDPENAPLPQGMAEGHFMVSKTADAILTYLLRLDDNITLVGLVALLKKHPSIGDRHQARSATCACHRPQPLEKTP